MAVVGDGSQILSLNRKYLYSKLETGKFLQRCFDEPAIKNEKKNGLRLGQVQVRKSNT